MSLFVFFQNTKKLIQLLIKPHKYFTFDYLMKISTSIHPKKNITQKFDHRKITFHDSKFMKVIHHTARLI